MDFSGLTEKIDDAVAGGRNACRITVRRDLIYQRLSSAAYQNEDLAALDAHTIGYRLLDHINDDATGADAMIFTNDAEVVIAFRGTQRNYADILTDLKFRKRDYWSPYSGAPIQVHRGFLDQWLSIRERVLSLATAAAVDGRQIVATGHSLGGALAVLATISWRLVAACITFGAPRVGTSEIREAIKLSTAAFRRYVHGADIVPIVPLLAMGFRHGVRPVYLTRGSHVIDACPLWRELLGRSRSVLTTRWLKGWNCCPVPARVFTDHRLGDYGAAMRRVTQ
ncbi:MAG: lipase family protein [Rhodospirillales bacterium]